MSTPIRRRSDAEVLQFMEANPDASDAEIRAFMDGTLPDPSRFKQILGTVGRNVEGALRTGLNIATLGLSDEIGGVIGGAIDPNLSIAEATELERKALREAPPVGKFIGETAGTVASALAGNLAATRSQAIAQLLAPRVAGGTASRALTSGAGSAAGSGAAAFGQAEGSPLERLDDAALGGALGFGIGGALPVIGTIGRAVGNATGIRQRFVSPARESADLINDALAQGGRTPDDIVKAASETPTVPQTAIDAGPDQLRDLAVSAQARSNTARVMARDLFEEQIEGERDRYIQRLQEALNPEDRDVVKVATELRDLRSANALRNFDPILDQHTISNPKVAAFFREKEVVRAYNQFRDNQITRFRAGEIPAEQIPPEIYRITTDDAGKRKIAMATTEIPLRAFHVVQQAVNEAINSGLEGGKVIPKARARTLLSALEQHMNAVEKEIPDYGRARAVYRDDSAPIHALRAGRGQKPAKGEAGFSKGVPNFATADAKEIAAWVGAKRSAMKADDVAGSEYEHYMLGAYSYLRSQLKGKTSTSQWLDLPKNKEKIIALMGGDVDAADEFSRALKMEQRLKAKGSVVRKGTDIQGDESIPAVGLDVGLTAAGISGGRPFATMASIGRILRGEHNMSDETAQAVIDRLMKGVGSLEDLIAGMEDLKAAEQARIRRRARNVGVAAGAAAGVTGSIAND